MPGNAKAVAPVESPPAPSIHEQLLNVGSGDKEAMEAMFVETTHGFRKKIQTTDDFFSSASKSKVSIVDRAFSKNPIVRLGARMEVLFSKAPLIG